MSHKYKNIKDASNYKGFLWALADLEEGEALYVPKAPSSPGYWECDTADPILTGSNKTIFALGGRPLIRPKTYGQTGFYVADNDNATVENVTLENLAFYAFSPHNITISRKNYNANPALIVAQHAAHIQVLFCETQGSSDDGLAAYSVEDLLVLGGKYVGAAGETAFAIELEIENNVDDDLGGITNVRIIGADLSNGLGGGGVRVNSTTELYADAGGLNQLNDILVADCTMTLGKHVAATAPNGFRFAYINGHIAATGNQIKGGHCQTGLDAHTMDSLTFTNNHATIDTVDVALWRVYRNVAGPVKKLIWGNNTPGLVIA